MILTVFNLSPLTVHINCIFLFITVNGWVVYFFGTRCTFKLDQIKSNFIRSKHSTFSSCWAGSTRLKRALTVTPTTTTNLVVFNRIIIQCAVSIGCINMWQVFSTFSAFCLDRRTFVKCVGLGKWSFREISKWLLLPKNRHGQLSVVVDLLLYKSTTNRRNGVRAVIGWVGGRCSSLAESGPTGRDFQWSY